MIDFMLIFEAFNHNQNALIIQFVKNLSNIILLRSYLIDNKQLIIKSLNVILINFIHTFYA